MKLFSSMRFLTGLLTLLLFSLTLHGQENRVRTRQVDYTEYDRLANSFVYAANKDKAVQELLKLSDRLFTPEDEEYFSVRQLIASYFESAGNLQEASNLLNQAIEAYEKHFPFFVRYGPVVNEMNLHLLFLQLSRIQRQQKLFEKNLRYLETKRGVLENNPQIVIRQQFFTELANNLVELEFFPEAIDAGLKLKDLTESGAFNMEVKSDEIFKIDTAWPKETQEQMKKSKVQYEKSMKEAQEVMLNTNRVSYNTILSTAYSKNYQYKEALPYSKAYSEGMDKMIEYSKRTLNEAIETYKKSPEVADSVLDQMKGGAAFMQQITDLGLNSGVIISAYKSDQPQEANHYLKGFLDKALQAHLSGNFNSAEQYYQQLFALIDKLANTKTGASWQNAKKNYHPFLVNLYAKWGQPNKSHELIKATIETEEKKLIQNFQYFTENEKREFFKNYTKELERYYSLLLLLIEKGNDQTGELLNKILQTKGLILDATREQEKQLRKIKDKVTLAQIAEIKRLRDKLAAFYQQPPGNPATADSINRLSVRIGDLERAVNLKLVALNIMKPVRWQDVQTRLKKGDVYLEILRLQRDNFEFDKPKIQYWALVIKPGESKPTLFQISEGEAFEIRSLRNYQNRVRTQSEDADSYNTYWKKINEQLQGAKTVIVSADGVYHIVNPVALQNPATKKFVLDEIEVKRVSTGRDLLAVADTNLPNKTIVLVGNPRFEMSRKQGGNVYRSNEVVPVEANENTRAGIEELPGTKKEVELISSKADGGGFQIKMLTGADANESNVKELKSPAVLHLATHGQFDQLSKADTYLKSKLILAGAADTEPLSVSDYALYEDGFLTAYEVTQLDLPETKLVVLSACETGLGEIQSGEGVWGLQRAFQLAGARSVMGSLWKISDEATVTFMDAFYEQYLRTNNISEAYRQAMQITRQQYPQPYYWGAFTLIGAN